MPVYASTIFLSAFLLFLVQPIIAKSILPWFGGSPAVWNSCMVFFQTSLLAGYAYANWTARKFSPRVQANLHTLLLLASLALLPILPDRSWQPLGAEEPVWRILALLGATIGLPYFLLAATGPLLQACASRQMGSERVYRLFALSNFGSLLALMAFPCVLEPLVTTHVQAVSWSFGYGLFALLCAASVQLTARSRCSVEQMQVGSDDALPPRASGKVLWITLSALGTAMLLAVTNHITQNVASIPLLWLAPLALYLLSFILSFAGRALYRRWVFIPALLVLVPAMAWGLREDGDVLRLDTAIPLYCGGLFVTCMFLHGELARAKPAPRHLTGFYLMVSLGGALGGIGVGLGAPMSFPAYYELPLTLICTSLLSVWLLRPTPRVDSVARASSKSRQRKSNRSALSFAPSLLALGAALLTAWNAHRYQHDVLRRDTRHISRNFFGVLRVLETGSGAGRTRSLVHGVITHGVQSFDPEFQRTPVGYYASNSGVGRAFAALGKAPRRVGVVGLGAGALAAYGRAGDVFRFYEINPTVIELARSEFTYLADTPAHVETVLGDGRLSLERETPQAFDLLVLDAFSSDSIPMHLITLEAFDVYLEHLAPTGVIAFHVTNRYLDLKPVVKQLAQERGLRAVHVHEIGESRFGANSDWVLIARDPKFFESESLWPAKEISSRAGSAPWTDDFSNLLQVLK